MKSGNLTRLAPLWGRADYAFWDTVLFLRVFRRKVKHMRLRTSVGFAVSASLTLATVFATAVPGNAAPLNISVARSAPMAPSNLARKLRSRQLVRSASVASCPANLLYVSDAGNGIVHIFPVAPRQQPECGRLTGFDEPQGLALDNAGDLFVANTSASTIEKFKPGHTNPSMTINDAGEYPAGVSVNASGLIAVTNIVTTGDGAGSVSVFKANGTLIGTFSDPNAFREFFPKIDASGNIYTTYVTSGGIGTVNEFLAPNYATVLEYSNISLAYPGGVDLYGGLLYVGDQGAHTVGAYEDGFEFGLTPLADAGDPVTFEIGLPIGCALLCTAGQYPLYVADAENDNAQEYITSLGTLLHTYQFSDGEPTGIAVTRPQ